MSKDYRQMAVKYMKITMLYNENHNQIPLWRLLKMRKLNNTIGEIIVKQKSRKDENKTA